MDQESDKSAEPLTLLLRKTRVQAQISGWDPKIWGEDDYCILDGERDVGRIYRQQVHGVMKWWWFLQTDPATPPNSGVVDTLKDAKVEFKRRYLQVNGRV